MRARPRAPPGTGPATSRAGAAATTDRRGDRSGALDRRQHLVEGLAHGQPVGLDDDRVVRSLQRRYRSLGIELIPPEDLVQELLPRPALAPRGELLFTPACALARGRGEEDLPVGVRQDHRADVAADHHDATLAR